MTHNKRKIINDPVFGFISIPSDLIYDLVQHPYFQRLNRIKQLGLSAFVYPGAQHTRMLHSLGAMHLMSEALKQLRQKGVDITAKEEEAALAAILLHDIGHGPFSHVLENTLIHGISHEEISLLLIEKIDGELGGKLKLALQILKNEYHKPFLHQLISGQLDMDRMDYLRRDSFFTGVTEGTVGSARIIKMLNVKDGNLVVDEKGIYSLENFLFARRFMYWQVYLHKTSVAAECMLINLLRRAKWLVEQGEELFATPALNYFLHNHVEGGAIKNDQQVLNYYVSLDDSDILSAIKVWATHKDTILSELSKRFACRQLFHTDVFQEPIPKKRVAELLKHYQETFDLTEEEAQYFLFEESPSARTYTNEDENILVLYRNGTVRDITEGSDILNVRLLKKVASKYYLCYLRD